MRGFTLIEAVLVIVVTGALFATVAHFIVPPVQAHLATTARAQLVDQADLALRRIGRDLRIALPNSARVSTGGLALELIPTTGGARYMAEGANRLVFGTPATSFDLVGPALTRVLFGSATCRSRPMRRSARSAWSTSCARAVVAR